MKRLFLIALLAQFTFSILFIIHRFYTPMHSDLMFVILLFALFNSVFLFWHSFSNSSIKGILKITGIFFALMPVLWLLLLVSFVGSSYM